MSYSAVFKQQLGLLLMSLMSSKSKSLSLALTEMTAAIG